MPYCKHCCPWNTTQHPLQYHYLNALNQFDWDELEVSDTSIFSFVKLIGGIIFKKGLLDF